MSNKTKLRPAARGTRPGPAGTRSGRPVVWLILAFCAGALLAGPIGAATADPRSDTDKKIDQLKEADAKRDAAQIVTLTDQARKVSAALVPVLDGLATAVPPGKTPGPDATAQAVTTWRILTRQAVDDYADRPSAGTGVNVARSAFAAAVDTLDRAVSLYEEALRAAPEGKAALLTLAGRERNSAVTVWSVGATQLDKLNVDAGNGHAHVFLPAVPGQGALTSDGSPEGSK
jgi:hypothetical protein